MLGGVFFTSLGTDRQRELRNFLTSNTKKRSDGNTVTSRVMKGIDDAITDKFQEKTIQIFYSELLNPSAHTRFILDLMNLLGGTVRGGAWIHNFHITCELDDDDLSIVLRVTNYNGRARPAKLPQVDRHGNVRDGYERSFEGWLHGERDDW